MRTRPHGIIGATLACGVLALAATPAAAHPVRCGTFHAPGAKAFSATVLRGPVKCSVARHVLSDFLHGKGKLHGPPNGPAPLQSWTLDGWTCAHGAGGAVCIHGGKTFRTARDRIEALAL